MRERAAPSPHRPIRVLTSVGVSPRATRTILISGLLPLAAAALLWGAPFPPAAQDTGLRFEIVVPQAAHAAPVTGRIYVMISEANQPPPYLQIGRTGTPFFGRDVETLPAGIAGTIDRSDLGTPVESLDDIPPGDYWVQGFVNVYSEFRRGDGHVVWMHDDQWEGQDWNQSPGNLYSDAQRVRIDPGTNAVIRLEARHVIPPVQIPADTDRVRRFRFQSPMLTEFWGRPIYLGATVLLPKDYETSTIDYPVIYEQGHFSLDPPLGFGFPGSVYLDWEAEDFPRFIAVTFQHPTPYFDDSYAVNSVNVGPYADAILEELIPEIESRFRTISEPWARILTGGSTGGWEALALQIFEPDFFGGTWAYCPDPVDFHNVEAIDVYGDGNAFYKQFAWRQVPTPNTRETDGQIRLTSRQRNHFELVNGTRGRSGEQFDAWSAVYGPLGDDGYFRPLFDKLTGAIDPSVADYWRDHFDLRYYLERNWAEVGPKLVDKLHVYAGTMDNFYLNVSTRLLEDWLETTTDPHYAGDFEYGVGAGHCWSGDVSTSQRLREIAAYLLEKKPADAPAPWLPKPADRSGPN
jgi:Putative esterase